MLSNVAVSKSEAGHSGLLQLRTKRRLRKNALKG